MSDTAVLEVIARLEAWAEGENMLANVIHTSTDNEAHREGAANRRDNYMELVRQLSGAVEDMTEGRVSAADPLAEFVKDHIIVTNVTSEHPAGKDAGRKAYREVSHGINGSPMGDFMLGWLEAFQDDHPTLQASLYRELNAYMRTRYIRTNDSVTGLTAFTDGRIAGDLPKFICDGYIPFI